MAQLIFAQAKSIRKKALKEVNKLPDVYTSESIYPGVDHDLRNRTYNAIVEKERHEFCEILKIAKMLHNNYENMCERTATNWYFITVRPRPNSSLPEFTALIEKYVNRAFVLDYTLSLEQKDINGSGEGFHTHIILNSKHRSKGECLRDTISTFAKVADNNCIEVKPTRNPQDIIQKYMVEYESEDNHKASTKQGDELWRKNNNILPLYDKNDNPFCALSIKSVGTEQNFLLELD